MNCSQDRPSTRIRFPIALLGLVLGPVGLAGCSDHRISVTEFLQMQAAMTEVPTTQPVVPPEVEAALDRELGRYRVGPGDVVLISVYGLDATTTLTPIQVRIDKEGQLELPAVGKIPVAGKDILEVEQQVREALIPRVFQDVVINVTLIEPEATRVLVYGAVVNPGLVSLRRTERNLLFALVNAGGVSQLASGRVVLRRLREPGREVELNLLDPEELKAALALDPLRDGDVISVEAATPNTVFVGGLVNAPRPQSYPPGTTINVLQAIAASGGLRTDVTPTEMTLIRRMPDGEDVQVKLDIDRVQKGLDPNLTLAAGDVLWVPDTVLTRVQDWINRNVFVRAGATATYNLNYSMPGTDFLNTAARQSQIGGGGGNLQDSFDPFGFLLRNQALQNIQNAARP